jgi:hypothetical protein
VFCTNNKAPVITSPTKTYFIRAYSKFRFIKWETKDTLFAFSDVCKDTTTTGDEAGVIGTDDFRGEPEAEVDSLTNNVEFRWETKKEADTQAFYRLSDATSWTPSDYKIELKTTHVVVVTGLEFNKNYEFKVKSGGIEKPGSEFSTLSDCSTLIQSACIQYITECIWSVDECQNDNIAPT